MKSENLVTSAQKVDIDWTSISNYSRLVEEEIDEYSSIEVTEGLKEGGIHSQKAWGFWFDYLSERVWKTSLTAETLQFCDGIGDPRILSLGCGYGGVELEIAQSLKSAYQMTAVDLNPGILAKARSEAQAKNLNIQFLPLDLNFVQIREKSFDLVIAHASLHHLLNLEHVFSQIHRGMKDHGRLIVQDIIGKTQVIFWKPNVDFAIDLVNKMPPKYKAGIVLPPYFEPSIQIGMEGVRQEEIEALLSDYFTPVKMFKYGSFMRMICTHPNLGKRFDPDIEEDRQYLQRLFDLDLRQIEEGVLRPTEILAVYEKKDAVDVDALNAEAHARMDAFLTNAKIQSEQSMPSLFTWLRQKLPVSTIKWLRQKLPASIIIWLRQK
ncbi:MAG: class I SAM-dependent methyltransferase [Proteobacteria bacterium]|nr:class I SAM-dependent methyltransferase [Pseudomonadota bacterium]